MTSVSDGSMIVDIITKYADSPAHYLLDDKLFLSTFQETDSFADVSFDWQKDVIEPIEKKTGKSVVFVPGTYKTDVEQLFSDDFTDGVFSWPHQSMSIEKDQKLDQSFADTAASSDKMWMASVAPWFLYMSFLVSEN